MYIIGGEVIKGKQRGKDLGFPTANFLIDKKIPTGIYVSKTKYNGLVFQSITFIGVARTFNETLYQAETYLLDIELNLYGKIIEVELLKKIRDNEKFDNVFDLIKAMKQDEKIARIYFSNNNMEG